MIWKMRTHCHKSPSTACEARGWQDNTNLYLYITLITSMSPTMAKHSVLPRACSIKGSPCTHWGNSKTCPHRGPCTPPRLTCQASPWAPPTCWGADWVPEWSLFGGGTVGGPPAPPPSPRQHPPSRGLPVGDVRGKKWTYTKHVSFPELGKPMLVKPLLLVIFIMLNEESTRKVINNRMKKERS